MILEREGRDNYSRERREETRGEKERDKEISVGSPFFIFDVDPGMLEHRGLRSSVAWVQNLPHLLLGAC